MFMLIFRETCHFFPWFTCHMMCFNLPAAAVLQVSLCEKGKRWNCCICSLIKYFLTDLIMNHHKLNICMALIQMVGCYSKKRSTQVKEYFRFIAGMIFLFFFFCCCSFLFVFVFLLYLQDVLLQTLLYFINLYIIWWL